MATYFLILVFTVIVHSNARGFGVNYILDNELHSTNYITTPYNINYDTSTLTPQNDNGFQNLFHQDKVKIQVYYECLCPDCRNFDSKQFKDTVRVLGPYLDIYTYPYGNAQTIIRNGKYEFKCQHGPDECYGNKLHACAIDHIKNNTLSVFFNACMMDDSQAGRGSDDRAADVCGQSMGINSDAIKQCAKSDRGTLLLKYYGDESKKANFNSVPHILINGKQNSGDHFMRDVCKAFTNPPPACKSILQSSYLLY